MPRHMINMANVLLTGTFFLFLMICQKIVFLNQVTPAISSHNNSQVFLWKIQDMQQNGSRTIFFHETSGGSSLNFRQSCSLESAARYNPERSIKLFMLVSNWSELDYNSPWLEVVKHYPNVTVSLITGIDRLHEFFTDSPLEDWFFSAEWSWSSFRVEHLTQYMKLVNLYKNGGLFLDLDFVTTKRLDINSLWNVLVFLDDERTRLSSSMFHLEYGHHIINLMIESLVQEFDVDSYNKGADILLNLFVDICIGSYAAKKMNIDQCKNVSFLSKDIFFPIPYWSWNSLFQNVTKENYKVDQTNKTYGIHTWNALSYKEPLFIGSKQLYAILAINHCPLTASKHKLFLR